MAATPPPKTPDRHYDFRSMNVVFAISSLAFLAITLFMVLRDYARPWKRVQAEFRDLDRAAATKQLEEERQQVDQTQIAAVEQEIAKAQADLDARRGEVGGLEEEIAAIARRRFAADARMRATKSSLDAGKYQFDVALRGGEEKAIAEQDKHVDELTARWIEQQREVQELDTERAAKLDQLRERQAAHNAAEKHLAELTSSLTGLQTRLASLDKDLAYFALNAPLMDFLAPSLKIEQVMLPGLYHDINFTTTDRVDRCMTCHQAANRAGYDGEQWPEPYRTHPRPELFVSDGSPHPYNQFGCTVCHAGLDRATDFSRAGHTPKSEEQSVEWEAKHGWEKQKFLETPIYPVGFDESGCLTCHADNVWTPGAHVVDTGRKLVNKMGCYGCHEIDKAAFTDMREDRARPAQGGVEDHRRLGGQVGGSAARVPSHHVHAALLLPGEHRGRPEQGVPARRDRVRGRLSVEQVGAHDLLDAGRR